MQLKKMALGKFQRWLEGVHFADLRNEPMHLVRRRALAELNRKVKDAMHKDAQGRTDVSTLPSVVKWRPVFRGRLKSPGTAKSQLRAVALGLCKELGLLVKSVDEMNEE
eukprot:CAMPEP_0180187860 /NCGR_PEP_ID=MMETSP0986-20121125/43771_1 /TAXON_ID=697907 /ORGANISM="non described non described, Strain CCMP2293" /LENGTH=108 /DNA_ID=CAMNT_0022142017 /DNA_START=1 /DNA_END=324 /DNA_ORIENTATION=+